MKRNFLSKLGRQCCQLVIVVLSNNLFASDSPLPPLPDWQILEFEHHAFLNAAKSSLELNSAPGEADRWTITVRNSVANNSEKIYLEFDPVSGRALKRTRLSSGKDKRFKTFDYGKNSVRRERRDPSDNATKPPSEWEVTSVRNIDYPPSDEQEVVTDAYALIVLAGQLIERQAESMEFLVHTEFNFYKVTMVSRSSIPISVDYNVDGIRSISGKRQIIAVKVKVEPQGELVEDSDFSLLGLTGYVIMFFDRETGLLLRLLGDAPHLGTTEINLSKVHSRDIR